MDRTWGYLAVALAVGLLTAWGCSGSDDAPAPAAKPASGAPSAQGGQGGEKSEDMELMKEELAKLPAEDRASAEKQHTCPVSGKMLGTMGAPIKVDVKGQQVWICCAGCKDPLLEKPDEHLAKLKKD